jgi:hypothetical protein
VPLGGIQIGPDDLQVAVTKNQVKSAPNIEIHGDGLSQDDGAVLMSADDFDSWQETRTAWVHPGRRAALSEGLPGCC